VGDQENNRFADLTHFSLNHGFIRTLDADYCRKHEVALLGDPPATGSDKAALGMLDISDDKLAFDVEMKIGHKIRRVQLNADELDCVLEFGFEKDSETGLAAVIDIGKNRMFLSHDDAIEFSRNQSTAKMTAAAFAQAIKSGASDIHIETYNDDVDLRFRIDGILQQIPTPFSKENIKKIASHIKILSDLDITEHRVDQDGRISTIYRGDDDSIRQIDMRLSFLPGPHGSDIVIRILDENRINIGLEKLGFDESTYVNFNKVIKQPGGLIIVAGPTASGKTTTLYSALRTINNDGNKILTVEDPIEYVLPKVNQKQVSAQMSFADYARAFMRQNPDILMIGEIRDEETASIAMRAAQMGHLVFTSIHSRDVQSALDRLQILCNDRSLVASSIVAVLSQRLLRRVCDNCLEEYRPDADIMASFPFSLEGITFVHGAGCEECNNSGFKGQIGVFELLVFDDDLRHKVWSRTSIDLESVAEFSPMISDALQKVRDHVTTLEEVIRTVPVPD